MLRSSCLYLAACFLLLTACSSSGSDSAATGGEAGGTPTNIATLASILISSGTLSPAFNADVLTYTVDVASSVAAISITTAGVDSRALVSVDGKSLTVGTASDPISLAVGPNTLNITVTAADAVTVRTYTVTVTRAAPPLLTGLTLSSGSLGPFFDPNTTAYVASGPFLIPTVSVTPSAAGGAITVNGNPVASGQSEEVSLVGGENMITVRVTGAGAELRDYVVTFTRQSASQFAHETFVKASNTDADDRFGSCVALSGDTMAVGAPRERSSTTGVGGNQANNSSTRCGAVYVFTRSGTSWSQQAYIKASNSAAFDDFGASVALSGDTLAVGATGEDSDSNFNNSGELDNSASSSGAVYIFTRNGTTWSQRAYVKAPNSDANDNFGISVALDGNTLAVGATREDGIPADQGVNNQIDSGAVYVFTGSNTFWTLQAYIKSSKNSLQDFFGSKVALSSDTLAVTSDDVGTPDGAVYVFTRSGSNWSEQAYLKASNTDTNDGFGTDVALSGDTLAVGAPFEDSNATGVNATQSNNSASNSGAVYVFTRNGTAWNQQAYLKASNTGTSDEFGLRVAIDGDTLAVGAWNEDSSATGVNGSQSNNNAANSGAVYLFTRAATTWSQEAYIKASNTNAGDEFVNLALSGATLAVGARYEDSNAIGINGSQSSNGALDSGAVYVLR